MGLFNRKKDKAYSLQDAMRLLKTDKFAKYTAVETNDGTNMYKLVPEEEALNMARERRNREKVFEGQRAEFLDRMTGNGEYINLKPKNYNNYEVRNNYKSKNI